MGNSGQIYFPSENLEIPLFFLPFFAFLDLSWSVQLTIPQIDVLLVWLVTCGPVE